MRWAGPGAPRVPSSSRSGGRDVFASAFDDALQDLPDAWRTATFDMRIEAALDAGMRDLSAEEAGRSIDGLGSCPPARSADTPDTVRVTVSSDSSGVTREMMANALNTLDRYRLRGELRLAN